MSGVDRSPVGADKDADVQVILIEDQPRSLRRGIQIAVLVGTVIVAVAGVFAARMALAGPGVPDSTLDARALVTASPTAPAEQGPASTRLALLGPLPLLPGGAAVAAGAQVPLPLPALPPGSSAVLLEVTLSAANGPGEVAVESAAGRVTALRLGRAGAQMTATVVAPLGKDNTLTIGTEGGGQLVVNLVGAFEPARESTSGRLVPVPATEVINLVPRVAGKDATVDLAAVPALTGQGFSAVVLQFAGDVGANGGFVVAGPSPDKLGQMILWNPTTPDDRIRGGFLIVPVTGGSLHVHYEAGNVLTVDLIGYVTDTTAPESSAGLMVPAPPAAGAPVAVTAGQDATIAVTGSDADAATGALLTLTATGDALGPVTVHTPGGVAPKNPTLTAAPGGARQTVTLVATSAGAVQVGAAAGATVSVTTLALLL